MALKIKEVFLNENLINSQEIQEDEVHAIKSLHVLLELVSNNPELVGTEQASEIVHGIEFAFQKLWNFPMSRNHHRYQFMIEGCECPKMDNEDMFRSGQPYRYYNMNCPIHSTITKKTEASEAEETKLLHKHELNEDLVSENEEIEFIKTFLKMFPK